MGCIWCIPQKRHLYPIKSVQMDTLLKEKLRIGLNDLHHLKLEGVSHLTWLSLSHVHPIERKAMDWILVYSTKKPS